MEQDKTSLSALEKVRLAKQKIEEEKKSAEEKARQEDLQKAQNINADLETLKKKKEDLEKQKGESEKTAEEAKAKKIKAFRGVKDALKEMKSSPETEEMLKNKETRQEIFGDDLTVRKEARAVEEGARMKTSEIEKEIEETIRQIEELTKLTPEWKEAEALRIENEQKEEAERIRAEEEKKKLAIADKILNGKNVSLSEFESGRDSNLVPLIDSRQYAQLSDEQKAEAVDALKLRAKKHIEASMEMKGDVSDNKKLAEDFAKIEKFNEGKEAAMFELAKFKNENRNFETKFKELLASLEQKVDDVGAQNFAKGIRKWGDNEAFIYGGHVIRNLVQAEDRLKLASPAYPLYYETNYDPKEVIEYINTTRARATEMLKAMEDADAKKADALLKNDKHKSLDAKAIITNKTSTFIRNESSFEKAKQIVEKKTKEINDRKENLFALVDIQAEQRVAVGTVNNLKREAEGSGPNTYNGMDDLKYDIDRIERDKKKANEALYLTKSLEAQYADDLNKEIEFKPSNGIVEFVDVRKEMTSIEDSLKTLRQEKEGIEKEKGVIETAGYSTGFLDKLSKISKAEYDIKIGEVQGRIDAKQKEINDANKKYTELANKKLYLNNIQSFDDYKSKIQGSPKTLKEYLNAVVSIVEEVANKKIPENKKQLIKTWEDLKLKEGSAKEKLQIRK